MKVKLLSFKLPYNTRLSNLCWVQPNNMVFIVLGVTVCYLTYLSISIIILVYNLLHSIVTCVSRIVSIRFLSNYKCSTVGRCSLSFAALIIWNGLYLQHSLHNCTALKRCSFCENLKKQKILRWTFCQNFECFVDPSPLPQNWYVAKSF